MRAIAFICITGVFFNLYLVESNSLDIEKQNNLTEAKLPSPHDELLLKASESKKLNVSDSPVNKIKVINGFDLPQGKLKFIVSLRGDDPDQPISTYCGGILVHPYWVMTAAHCFIATTQDGNKFNNPELWHVQMGSVKIDLNWGDKTSVFDQLLNTFLNNQESYEKPEHYHVEKIIQHPKYLETDLEYDIAMLKLTKPVDVSRSKNIETALLPPKSKQLTKWPKIGTSCFLAGWGCTKAGGNAVKIAQYANFEVLANERCSEIYNHGAGLNADHEFCAGYHKKGVGICPGDSGSGLFCKHHGNWVTVGIASATHRKQPGEYPGIFTRVAYFRDWLEEVVSS